MADDHRPLVVRVLFVGAGVLGLLAVLSGTGALPIEHGARRVMTLAFGIAAAGDALMALVLWLKSNS